MSKRTQISNISASTEQAILRKTAYALPDRPSESGMRADEIKKAFYSAMTDSEDSILSETKRIVNEANEVSQTIYGVLNNTIPFVEEERQKSKNLFDKNSILPNKEFASNGNIVIDSTTGFCISDYIDVSDCEYVFVSTNKTSGYSNVFFDENYNKVHYISQTNGNIAIPQNLGIKYYRVTIPMSLIDDFQIEKVDSANSVGTEYQPFNGAISHKGDNEIEFAKSEYEKSKNLLPSLSVGTYISNTVYFATYEDGRILVNGTATDGNAILYFDIEQLKRNLKPNTTYTISTGTGGVLNPRLIIYTGSYYQVTDTLNLTYDVLMSATQVYLAVSNGEHADNVVVRPMIRISTSDGSYQAYNGEIVHRKNVDYKELIYDKAYKKLDKTFGILGGDSLSNLDLTKYKKLIIHTFYSYKVTGISEIDLTSTSIASDNVYRSTTSLRSENNNSVNNYTALITVNSDKTELTLNEIGYVSGTTYNDRNGYEGYIIYRIEGVY